MALLQNRKQNIPNIMNTKKEKVICGIQQVGIGVEDLQTSWRWYNKHLNIQIPMVDDEGVAERMLPYTGGKPQPRHAILAITLRGGGGFEIWQPQGRKVVNHRMSIGSELVERSST